MQEFTSRPTARPTRSTPRSLCISVSPTCATSRPQTDYTSRPFKVGKHQQGSADTQVSRRSNQQWFLENALTSLATGPDFLLDGKLQTKTTHGGNCGRKAWSARMPILVGRPAAAAETDPSESGEAAPIKSYWGGTVADSVILGPGDDRAARDQQPPVTDSEEDRQTFRGRRTRQLASSETVTAPAWPLSSASSTGHARSSTGH